MKKDFLEKYLFFLRDWDNHAATIFNRSQLAYLENMQEPRAWGAEPFFEIGKPFEIKAGLEKW